MEELTKVEFEIQISIEDTTDEELDEAARRLLNEVKDLHSVDSVGLTSSQSVPEGSKGDAITIGSLAVVVLPTAIPSLIALVQAWMLRGQGRTVKFKGKVGRQLIEFEGPPDELQKLINSLQAGKKK